MSVIEHEQRRHDRVEFLLVPVEREQVPVWLFKPPARQEEIAGLIVNLSDGGMQVLTSAAHALDFIECRIELMLGEEEGVAPFSGRARRVWTHAYSKFGNISGMQFLEPSAMATFVAQFKPAQARRAWLRCLLSRT